MNNNKQNINAWFATFQHRFERAVPIIVAETATEYYKERFWPQNEDWEKVKWQKLSPKYAAKKTFGKGRILTARTNLSNSIRPSSVKSNRVVISAGSKLVPYAKIHNEGGRISGAVKVRRFTNTNFMGTGRAVEIKAHTRYRNFTMPKRQFMGHSKYLNQRLTTRLIKAFE